ncbi:MAG: PQQ-binding-like beta-propeller repeat protein [Myxococcales bacterium]|nr:PQQ-binding-like beta-propeller repeat protein [Myxococcales bacterium]
MPRAPALALAALAALAALPACGPAEPTSVIHPGSSDAARAVLEVEFMKPITITEMAILRPDERAVVTSDPERGWLYVGSRDGSLLVLDAEDGHLIWEHALGGAIASEPVLLPGEPVLLIGTDNGSLTALDVETRAPRWTYETQGTIRGRPLLVGDVVYFANSRDQVFALDVRSGSWRWQYEQPLPTDFTVFGRAGLAFVDEHAGEAVPEGGVVLTGFSNGRVVAIGAGSGEALWITSVAPPEGGAFVDADSTPLVVGGDEVVVSGQATGVYGLSLADGAERWHRPVRGAGTVIDAGDGSLIFASSLEGIFSIERGGRLRWRQQQDPGVLSEPVLVGSVVLIGHSEQGLGAYDRISGELLARLDVGSGISGKPALDPVFGRMYAITNRGFLLAFRIGEGASASAS